MRKMILGFIVMTLALVNIANAKEETAKPEPQPQVYFISPVDGQTVKTKFKVQFGLSGMGIAPAGVEKDNTGHHHLLIDTDIAIIDLTKPLPATDKIKHFGGGQTETYLELPQGKHTLQLVLGNHLHIPHTNPVTSEKITIMVQ
jgi:Domain of unknown function (DUF4399)